MGNVSVKPPSKGWGSEEGKNVIQRPRLPSVDVTAAFSNHRLLTEPMTQSLKSFDYVLTSECYTAHIIGFFKPQRIASKLLTVLILH